MRPCKIKVWAAIGVAPLLFGGSPAQSRDINDYPTVARADYVFACMKANGETRRALAKDETGRHNQSEQPPG